MVFNNRIKEVQKIVYDGFKVIFESIAGFLGYPNVPGMPIFPLDPKARDQIVGQDLLPKHISEISWITNAVRYRMKRLAT